MLETQSAHSARMQRSLAVIALGVAALLVAGALALWAYYGTAVFYEVILAGLNACF